MTIACHPCDATIHIDARATQSEVHEMVVDFVRIHMDHGTQVVVR